MAASNSSPLLLSTATEEDVPDIVNVWYAAFKQPIITSLWPDTPNVRDWWRDWHLSNLKRPNFKYLRIQDPASRDENGKPRLVAFGVWDTAMADERGRRFPPWAADSNAEKCDLLIDTLESERKRVMGDQKHYYLDSLGTHPDYQRRGAGRMLVQWGCDLADKDGVGAYVDASKEGATLYARCGFVDYSPGATEIASMGYKKQTA